MQKHDYKISWNWVLLFLFAVGIGIFLLVTPKYIDDYWYMWEFKSWYNFQGIWYPTEGGNVFKYGIPWEELKLTWKYHIEEDNMRVCNMVGPFWLIFPKWLGSLTALISVMISMILCLKLVKININKSWLVSICIALWVLTISWREHMGCLIYQYNYLVSGMLFLILCKLLFNDRRGWKHTVLLAFMSIICSVWHEGFSMPFLGSVVVLILMFKKSRDLDTLLVAIILILGLLWHFIGSSTSSRFSQTWMGLSWRIFLRQLFFHKGYIIAFIFCCIYIYRNGLKTLIKDRMIVFMLVSIITSFWCSYFSNVPRAGWWGDITSIVLILYLLRKFDFSTRRGYKGWRMVTSAFLMIVSGVFLVFTDIYTLKYANEFPKIIGQYIKEPGKTQFSDLLNNDWQQLLMKNFLTTDLFEFPLLTTKYYDCDTVNGGLLKVVPSDLRDITIEKCEPLESNDHYMKYKGYLIDVNPKNTIEDYRALVLIDYGWFKTNDRNLRLIPFRSEADGKIYSYAYPKAREVEYAFGNLKGVINKDKPY